MSDRFDVIQFRKTKNGSTYALKVGSAVKRDDGGFNLWLEAIPFPLQGADSAALAVVPRREREQRAATAGAPFEDTVPF